MESPIVFPKNHTPSPDEIRDFRQRFSIILSEYEFVYDPNLTSPLDQYAIKACRIIGMRVDPIPPKLLSIERQTLDRATLSCAIILANAHPHCTYTNFALDELRKVVIEMLVEMGYEDATDKCLAIYPLWECYREWVILAYETGVTSDEIHRIRTEVRNRKCGYFEEEKP